MKNKGFTLIEAMLLIVVVSVVLMLGIGYSQQKTMNMQIDRVSAQMQQILNAALGYYVKHGAWPADLVALQDTAANDDFLPTNIKSPWNGVYTITNERSNDRNVLTVYTALPASLGNQNGIANIVAARLPLGRVQPFVPAQATNPPCDGYGQPACIWSDPTPTGIFGSVDIPGQNLSNATSINFIGLYYHGACVPIPTCPIDAGGVRLTPQVFIVPVSVSGANDTSNTQNVYPLSSFTGYATISATPDNAPPACPTGTGATCTGTSSSDTFWRACAQVVTQRGDLADTRSDAWGNSVTLAAFTRCARITNDATTEPSGNFNVWSD